MTAQAFLPNLMVDHMDSSQFGKRNQLDNKEREPSSREEYKKPDLTWNLLQSFFPLSAKGKNEWTGGQNILRVQPKKYGR